MDTRVIKKSDSEAVRSAAELVKNGGVFIYPTETLYGIGCSVFDEKSIDRIYKLKGRSYDKPLIILVKDEKQLQENFIISQEHINAYKNIPGKRPTLLLTPKTKFPERLVSKEGKVAVRISVNDFVSGLFHHIDTPIVSTSANISENENILNIEEVTGVFRGKVELIIDSGNLPRSKGSTILDLTVSPIKIIREGDTKAEDLEGFI